MNTASDPADASPDSVQSTDISLREISDQIIAGRWLILATVLLSLLAGWALTWLTQPVYRTDALLQVETDKSSKSLNQALGDMAEALGTQTPVAAELELLRSRMVVGKTVRTLGLDIQVMPERFPLIGEALARDRQGLGRPAAPFLGLASYAWGGEAVAVPVFEVPNRLLNQKFFLVITGDESFRLEQGGETVLAGRVGQALTRNLPDGTRVRLFVRVLRARPGTRIRLVRFSDDEAIARALAKLVVTERKAGSGMINVVYSDADPVIAQRFTNELLNSYQRQNVERRSADAAQTLEYLGQQLPEVRRKVEVAETAMRDYQLRQGASSLPQETEQMLNRVVTLESSRLELQQQRAEALRRFTENSTVVQNLDTRIASVGNELGRIQRNIQSLPQTQQELLSLNRDVQVNTTLYTGLLNSYQELQVAKAGTIGNARIIDYALLPLRPVSPDRAKIMLASLLAGLIGGVALVFLRNALARGVEDPAEVERRLSLPTYATIPFARAQANLVRFGRRSNQKQNVVLPVLAQADPANPAVESIRSLRTSLHFAMLEAENNVIMITGPSPGLGKSFVSINLGAVLALTGRTVVVVDADMRLGHLHDYVDGVRANGISEVISGQRMLEQVLRPTTIQGLCFIATGEIPPNPSELLLHKNFDALLQELGRRFDYVVVDSPPVLAVTDASIIGALAGTTMVVLKAGEHDMRVIEETVRRLRQAGTRVKGTVFNQMGRGLAKGNQYGYRYGYAYNYKDKAKSA